MAKDYSKLDQLDLIALPPIVPSDVERIDVTAEGITVGGRLVAGWKAKQETPTQLLIKSVLWWAAHNSEVVAQWHNRRTLNSNGDATS